jgi:hypothetical protein
MWKRSRCDSTESVAQQELAVECQAFLSGGYREYLEACGRPVPAWAWLNQLAHGDRADLETLAVGRGAGSGPESLLCCIAARLCAVIDRGDTTLEWLQQWQLIPLERSLAGRGDPVPRTEDDLARALAAALVARAHAGTPRLRPPQQ